jgi:hypothetical protein
VEDAWLSLSARSASSLKLGGVRPAKSPVAAAAPAAQAKSAPPAKPVCGLERVGRKVAHVDEQAPLVAKGLLAVKPAARPQASSSGAHAFVTGLTCAGPDSRNTEEETSSDDAAPLRKPVGAPRPSGPLTLGRRPGVDSDSSSDSSDDSSDSDTSSKKPSRGVRLAMRSNTNGTSAGSDDTSSADDDSSDDDSDDVRSGLMGAARNRC